MHTCRLKAGFPTIFEIISAKTVGGVKYISVQKSNLISFKKTYWYIHVDLKQRFTQDL